jgi:aldose 1-epimerase
VESFLLERGNTRVTVVPEAGGRIAQCAIFDGNGWLPLLYDDAGTPMEARDALAWGCYAMVPWPNRIRGGAFAFEGKEFRLSPDSSGHALHGLGVTRPWHVEWRTTAAIGMSLDLQDAGWPWPARVLQRVDVADDEVRLAIDITAPVGVRFPAGCGWHPWFLRTLGEERDARVLVDANEYYELEDMIPTGRILPADGDSDLRAFPMIGARRLDDCYRDLRAPLRLRWGSIELTMRVSPNVKYAVVYTPPHAVCVEPQTCAIDAFNLDARGSVAGTAVVDAGHPLSATSSWRWSLIQAADAR